MIAAVLAIVALQAGTADSLLVLAGEAPATALVAHARARPLAFRDAVAEAFARVVRSGDEKRRTEVIEAARRLADAHSVAWGDAFLVGRVARFRAWPPDRRAANVRADSLRRAGIRVFAREGPEAATTLWRESLRIATAIDDSSAAAAALGNLGAAFLRAAELDSAQAYLERGRVLARAAGDRRVEVNAMGALAAVALERGDLAAAQRQLEAALSLRRRIGDHRGAAADHNQLGLLARELADAGEARRRFEAALTLNRRGGWRDAAATNLTNLAALAATEGEFARASSLYRQALATYRELDMAMDAADVLRGLGQLEARRGDYRAAGTLLREARAIYDETGLIAESLSVQADLAAVLAAMGEPQRALDELREAEQRAEHAQVPVATRADLALARADLSTVLNHYPAAERGYAEAERLYSEAGDPWGQAAARQGTGLLLLALDAYGRAEQVLAHAARAQDAVGDPRSAAVTRMLLARALRGGGDPEAARELLQRVVSELARLGDPVAQAAALGELAEVEAERGFPLAAEAHYAAALGLLEGRAATDVSWRLRAGRALLLRARRADGRAAAELRLAVDEIERAGASLADPERRSAFHHDHWEVYAQLALTERIRGDAGAAFQVSDRLRAREMLEVLGRARVAPPAGDAVELSAREKDLRRRIAELTAELQPPARWWTLRGPAPAAAGAATHEALARAQQLYSELLLELRERAPREAELVAPRAAAWREVARRLPVGTAMVEYLVSDSGALAFIVTRDTLAAVDLGIARRDLARLVEFARGSLARAPDPEHGRSWQPPLHRLHDHLIRPAEETGLLAAATRLILVPHADLHYLPFGALLDGHDRFLVERYVLSYAPSASVWLTLGERSAPSSAAGILVLAPRPDALPGSGQEADAIARAAGPDALVLRGGAATEEAFRRAAEKHRVLHLATFGVLNRQNPLFSFVDLASGGDHDGRLEVSEVFGLRLAAELVVLSACETGLASGALADVPPGDDWIGLTRAFLHAGADRVVATLWSVDDRSTALFMERFYQRLLRGEDPAAAVAAAQRSLLAAGATAHPFYWAGFAVVGGAERRLRPPRR